MEVLGHRDGRQKLLADERIAGLVALRAQQLGEGLDVPAVQKPRNGAGEVNDRIEFVDGGSDDELHRESLFFRSPQRRQKPPSRQRNDIPFGGLDDTLLLFSCAGILFLFWLIFFV